MSLEQIPNMICAGILTGVLLDFLIPAEENKPVRKAFIIGGVCIAGAGALLFNRTNQ